RVPTPECRPSWLYRLGGVAALTLTLCAVALFALAHWLKSWPRAQADDQTEPVAAAEPAPAPPPPGDKPAPVRKKVVSPGEPAAQPVDSRPAELCGPRPPEPAPRLMARRIVLGPVDEPGVK